MDQQVDITLKLSLWLDATMDEDAIVTHVRSSLPLAFGKELTEMANPVDILEVRQEAQIFGNEEGSPDAPYTTCQLASDHATYGADAGKFIVTSADHEREFSGPMSEQDAKAFAELLNALWSAKETIDTLLNGLQYQINSDTGIELSGLEGTIEAAISQATRRAA